MVVSLEVVYRIDRFELLQNRRAHVAIARFGALAGSTYGATVR